MIEPYQDEAVLRRLYHDEGMTTAEIGEELDCNPGSISYWMSKHGIEARGNYHTTSPNVSQDEVPWRDRDTMYQLYVVQGLYQREIAEKLDIAVPTVSTWLKKHGIDGRTATEYAASDPAKYEMRESGHMRWRTTHKDTTYQCYIHQLLAIHLGADPHKVFSGGEWHCHHKNNIPWDNRPSNLDFTTREHHMRDHNIEHGLYAKMPTEQQLKLDEFTPD